MEVDTQGGASSALGSVLRDGLLSATPSALIAETERLEGVPGLDTAVLPSAGDAVMEAMLPRMAGLLQLVAQHEALPASNGAVEMEQSGDDGGGLPVLGRHGSCLSISLEPVTCVQSPTVDSVALTLLSPGGAAPDQYFYPLQVKVRPRAVVVLGRVILPRCFIATLAHPDHACSPMALIQVQR